MGVTRRRGPAGSSSGGTNQGAIEVCPFRAVVTVSGTASPIMLSVGALDLSIPNFGGRAAVMATNFEKWRLRSLKATGTTSSAGGFDGAGTTPTQTSTGVIQALAFSPIGVADFKTPPATLEALSQLDSFTLTNGYMRSRLSIPKRLLKPKLETKWLRTSTTDSPPYDTETHGSMWFAILPDLPYTGAIYPNLWVVVEGVIEFSTQILAADQLVMPHLTKFPALSVESDDDEKSVVLVKPKKKA